MLARLHFDPLPADGMDPSFPDAIVDARASTVQLGNGYLYLDAAADPARALLGYDDPAPAPAGAADVAALLESFAPGYRTLALAADRAAAVAAARGLAVDDAVVVDALDGEPALVSGAVVAVENRSLGRTGRWLASRSWGRPPEVVVIGEAIAAGAAFGAVLARADIAGARRTGLAADLDAATLARVAGVVAAAETAGLRQSAARLGDYLAERLAALAAVDNAILAVPVGLGAADEAQALRARRPRRPRRRPPRHPAAARHAAGRDRRDHRRAPRRAPRHADLAAVGLLRRLRRDRDGGLRPLTGRWPPPSAAAGSRPPRASI
jgi:hypothetical protein